MPLIDPMPSDAKYISSEYVRSFIDGALTKAEAADALPKSRPEALQRAAAAIERAERGAGASGAHHYFAAADRWMALASMLPNTIG